MTVLASYNFMRLLPPISVLAVSALAAGCVSSSGSGVQTAQSTAKQGFNAAAHAPFEDLNLIRSKIPAVLLDATNDPYAQPQPAGCETLALELSRLDDALGPDIDIAKSKKSRMDQGETFTLNAGARAMKDFTEGWIPMRSWVRYMTGAEQHSRQVTAAISAGSVRRAYLKGLAQSEGCTSLGPAQPVYLFPAPPHTPASVASQ
jgi:hypothetical protein